MTLSVGLRNMRYAKARIAFSVAGVAVATLLLVFVLALYRGWNDGLGAYIDETSADVWVAPFGSEGFFTPAVMSRTYVLQVRSEPGVREVHTLLYRPVKLSFNGKQFDTWVVGFTEGSLGGPVRMQSGSGNPGLGEIVIDAVEAKLAGLKIGDEVAIAGNSLKVVGIAEGNNVVFAQIAFISEEEARAEFQRAISDARLPSVPAGLDPKTNINLMLVKTDPGKAADVVAGINHDVPGINAFIAKDFSDNSKRALKQAIVPILLIILALAFLVGTLVLGLTVYTGVLEKEREFGVIKALGAPAPAVLRVVLEQALVCCVLGFSVGIVATLIATRIVTLAVPQFLTSVRLSDVALVFAGTLAMSVFASLVPVVRVMKVDTLSVFKA